MTDGYSDAYDDGYSDGCTDGHGDGWHDCKLRAIYLLQQDADEAERLDPQAAHFIRYCITVLKDEL